MTFVYYVTYAKCIDISCVTDDHYYWRVNKKKRKSTSFNLQEQLVVR